MNSAREYIFKLANVNQLDVVSHLSGDKLAAQAVASGCSLEVPLADLIDRDAERVRLGRDLEKVQKEIDGLERKLSNASFIERAPREVVEENRHRLADYQDQAAQLKAAMERLG